MRAPSVQCWFVCGAASVQYLFILVQCNIKAGAELMSALVSVGAASSSQFRLRVWGVWLNVLAIYF